MAACLCYESESVHFVDVVGVDISKHNKREEEGSFMFERPQTQVLISDSN